MATIPIATIVQWCGMTTVSTRKRIIADMMSPPEGLKHLNDEILEEMLGKFREYARRYAADGNIVFTRVQKWGWYPSWIGWRIGLVLRENYPFWMERQISNLYKNLRNPQLGRSAGKTFKKLGNLWSQLAPKYSSNLPSNGIVGWWSSIAT